MAVRSVFVLLFLVLVSASDRAGADTITLADAKAAWARSYARLGAAQGPEDYAKVLATMRPLAEAGLPEAAWVLGSMYERGAGLPADPALALDWYTKAAKGGDPTAAGILGDVYAQGRLGQAVDREKAVKWYAEGRSRGDSHANLCLALPHITGEGAAIDRAGALKDIYLGSDVETDREAQECLALLYSKDGGGVPRNLARAELFHRLASGNGNDGAAPAWPWSARLGDDLAAAAQSAPEAAARGGAAAEECRRILDAGGCTVLTEAVAEREAVHDPAPRWQEIFIPLKTFMIVPVRLGGKGPYEFILDSGAPYSSIDGDLARSLGLPECGHFNAYAELRKAYAADAAFLGNGLSGALFVEQPLKRMSLSFDRRISGILGYDILSRFVVEVDYAGRRIRLSDPATYAYAGKGSAVPLSFRRGLPYATATLRTLAGAKLTLPVLVDTGGGAEIFCGAVFNRSHEFAGLVPKLNRGRSARMLDGVYDTILGRFQSLTFGDLEIPFPVVSYLPKLEREQCAFTVGGSLLNRLNLVLDYPHSRLFMEPTEWLSVSQTEYGVETGP